MNSRMLPLNMTTRRVARVVVTCASLLLIGRLASAQTCSPPPGLVAWWPGESSAVDVSGSHNGTLVGGVTFVPGIVGSAFNFNGTDSSVQVPDSPALNPTAAITVEAWINPVPGQGGYPPIIKKNGNDRSGYALEMAGDRAMCFYVFVRGAGWAGACAGITPGQWTHVAGVYDGRNVMRGANPAIDSLRDLVYVPNAADGTVVVADGETLETKRTILLNSNGLVGVAGAMALDQVHDRLYVADSTQPLLWVVDPAGATPVVQTIALPGVSRWVEFNPSTGLLYVVPYGEGTVTVVDPANPLNLVSIPACAPDSVAINPVTNLIYVATECGPTAIIDGDAQRAATFNTVVGELPTFSGFGSTPAVAVSRRTNRVYVLAYSDAFGSTDGHSSVYVFDGEYLRNKRQQRHHCLAGDSHDYAHDRSVSRPRDRSLEPGQRDLRCCDGARPDDHRTDRPGNCPRGAPRWLPTSSRSMTWPNPPRPAARSRFA